MQILQISAKDFLNSLIESGFTFFTGVPDSTLGDFCNLLEVKEKSNQLQHFVAANEGSAVAIAAGYFLSTGKVPVVYMQNSGLGNAINPLTSIVHKSIYSVPMLVVVGHRGLSHGKKDEIQHLHMGSITNPLIDLMGFSRFSLDSHQSNFSQVLDRVLHGLTTYSQPVFLTVSHGYFANSVSESVNRNIGLQNKLNYREIISYFIQELGDLGLVVSSTGYISRYAEEILELSKSKAKHLMNFGGMGHVSSLAIGYGATRVNPKERIVILDGDGSALMHLGGVSTLLMRYETLPNVAYVVLNNRCHFSVGGQATTNPLFSFAHFFHSSLGADNFTPPLINVVQDIDDLQQLSGGKLFSESLTLTEVLFDSSKGEAPPRPRRDIEMFQKQFRRN